MKSVLISLDFIYKEDGTLHPTELNTNTKDDLSIGDITSDNFTSVVDGYFDHDALNSFMVSNSLTKMKVISVLGHDKLFKAFATHYGYEYELVVVAINQVTVPEVADADDTLIVRIAYDTYALIDDLYARDNYEFHNLIQGESFASPVTFNENGFDTITEFHPSQDGSVPNYVIKARTPGYVETEYPKGYRFDTEEELTALKQSLGDDEFIAKFEFNSELSLVDNRTHHMRTMSLICGSTLDVVNIIHYKSLNSVSTQNELLVYESEIDSNKKLNSLFISKYYPTWYSKTGLDYHSDSTDLILKPDDSLVAFPDLQIGDALKHIFFTEEFSGFEPESIDTIGNFSTGTSTVGAFQTKKTGIFINITVNHETYGQLNWYDGVGNRYVIRKSTYNPDTVIWTNAGFIEPGDEIMVYNNRLNEVILLTVESIYYDLKELDMYNISIDPKPEFLVKLSPDNDDLFLVQHNLCSSYSCRQGYGVCTKCSDCGKQAPLCIQCGGGATIKCILY